MAKERNSKDVSINSLTLSNYEGHYNYMKKRDKTVTESMLDRRLIQLKEEIRDEIVIMRDYLDEKSRGYRNEIHTRFDNFAGWTQTLEDKNTIGTEQIAELRKDVKKHEERLFALESKAA